MLSPRPFTTWQGAVHADWVDYNGHLRDAFYLLIFSYATDVLMDRIGLDSQNREASGHSLFTLECHLNYLHEVKQDAPVDVRTHLLGCDAKRLHLHHGLYRPDENELLAASEQMLLHVSLDGPRAAPFTDTTRERIAAIMAEQAALPRPLHVGRIIALPAARA
ncbi:acyl-CoA thioester hydrolase [Pseudomonas duriflava]|uniref:Acyl-CoA thioester hydrolase n=1 Tax=Pseudomonas duriflava TaxID=459528 RepID=A0A562QIE3_9PSED|nr:thioesterase family protein [Pseudomonas duriflava]TWI56514.1 acyl-CoA thioester hydrolase [Pseudomonas duriflava]